MSNFSKFMKANKIQKENVMHPVTKSLPDENGEPRYLQLSVDEEDDVIRNISVNSDLEWKYLLWKNEE